MKLESMFDVVCAAHLSSKVESPWKNRGGMILVAPPGHMKTSVIQVLESYRDVAITSDLNTTTLNAMRDKITADGVRTLALLDFQKLYERHQAVSSNLEGNIRALVEEGYNHSSHEDPNMNRLKARCVVIAGTTVEHYSRHWSDWVSNGFARRFLWCLYKMDDPAALMDAVERWEMLDFGSVEILGPRTGSIHFDLKPAELSWVRDLLRHQKVAGPTPFQFLCKIAAVLKWHYAKKTGTGNWKVTLGDFSECLSNEGAVLELPHRKVSRK